MFLNMLLYCSFEWSIVQEVRHTRRDSHVASSDHQLNSQSKNPCLIQPKISIVIMQ